MTFREKLKIEHPEKIDETRYGGCWGCPYEYAYELRCDRPCSFGAWYSKFTDGRSRCTACWDRVIPGTEEEPVEDMRKLPKGFIEVVESGWNIKHLINVRLIERVAPSSNVKCYLYMATVHDSSIETRFYEAAHSYDEVVAMIKEALE